MHDLDRDRRADVIGVGFEREPPDGDLLVLEHPERLADFRDKAVALCPVDPLDLFEQGERHAEILADGDECGDVLGKTRAAVADSGVEEVASDPAVHADPVGDLLDIRAAGLADLGDGVDVGNFQGEERIGCVLDELGRVDVGHQHGGHERLVDLLHEGDRALAVAADDDPVRLHEVGDRASFAQELRVADHVEFGPGLVVAPDRIRDLFAGSHGDGAFIHDDAVLAGFEDGGDFAGDFFDVGQVHAAVGLGRGGDGDEHDLRVVHPLLGARRKLQPLRGDVLVDQLFEARFVDGDFAGEQRVHLALVVVHADDVVADFREAGTRDKTDITGTNDADFHREFGRGERKRPRPPRYGVSGFVDWLNASGRVSCGAFLSVMTRRTPSWGEPPWLLRASTPMDAIQFERSRWTIYL